MAAEPQALSRVAIAGASGLIGGHLAQLLSADARCQQLHLPLRREVPALLALPKARAIPGGLSGPLPPLDAAFCALGTTIKAAGSQQAFRAVDFDAVLAFAQAAKAAGASRLAVVSALGADAQSGVFYNRVKAQAEQALRELGFASLVIARPSLLMGDRATLGQPTRPLERAAQRLSPWLAPLLPLKWRPIHGQVVARAMLAALAQDKPGCEVLESDALGRLGAAQPG